MFSPGFEEKAALRGTWDALIIARLERRILTEVAMMNRVNTRVTARVVAFVLLAGIPASSEVMFVNPSPGTYIPVSTPAPTAGYIASPASWPWGWTAPATVPWTGHGATPAMIAPGMPMTSVPAVAPTAYMTPVPVAYGSAYPSAAGVTIVPVPVSVPSTGAVAPAGYLPSGIESVVTLDRLIAAAETADEVRILLSRPDRLRVARADNLTRAFLKERIVNAEVARASGLTQEYLGWIYDTLVESGDRIGATVFIPNFRLLPATAAPSWNQVWSRSFAITYAAQSWGRSGLALLARASVLRAEASSRGTALQRLGAGTQVAVQSPAMTIGGSNWVQVRTANGFLGWIPAADLSASYATSFVAPSVPTLGAALGAVPASGIPYGGPESVILWRDQGRVPAGHDSAYGWVYPTWYQNVEVQAPAAPVAR